MSGAWDWRVEHENASGSARSDVEVVLGRHNLGQMLECRVTSKALKVRLNLSSVNIFSPLNIFQEPISRRVYLDVNVSPSAVTMSPENNHIEEGGKISVTCTAVQVSLQFT